MLAALLGVVSALCGACFIAIGVSALFPELRAEVVDKLTTAWRWLRAQFKDPEL